MDKYPGFILFQSGILMRKKYHDWLFQIALVIWKQFAKVSIHHHVSDGFEKSEPLCLMFCTTLCDTTSVQWHSAMWLACYVHIRPGISPHNQWNNDKNERGMITPGYSCDQGNAQISSRPSSVIATLPCTQLKFKTFPQLYRPHRNWLWHGKRSSHLACLLCSLRWPRVMCMWLNGWLVTAGFDYPVRSA